MSIFVNKEKLDRAKEIIAFVLGKKVQRDENEIERTNKFSKLLNEAKIKADSEEAIAFVYEKLGGLVRTETEQKVLKRKLLTVKSKTCQIMKKIKLFLIRFIARKHIKFITEQDVLRIVNRNLYLGDNKLSDEEIGILKEESELF